MINQENQNQNGIALPSQAEIEAIYNSIEQTARQQYQPQSNQKISPRILMIGLLSLGLCGAILGSSDLKIDPTVTFNTKLGQRTQPYWLVPRGAKVLKTDGGTGGIKGLGWAIGCFAGAGLWHVAGNDERWQRFVGTMQTQWVENFFKFNKAKLELQSMAALQLEKQELNTKVEVDLVEQRWQFNQAIGYDPVLAQSMQQPMNALPYGNPGTYADINNPSDKVEASDRIAVEGKSDSDLAVRRPRTEPDAETQIKPLKGTEFIERFRLIANKILNSLASINTSIFLAAPTRCGKTYLLHKWLGDVTTRFPQAVIYVISQKYEDFPGVSSDRLTVFDSMRIEESMRFLDVVYDELLTRKSSFSTEETYREFPVKLILEDWFATHQCLSQGRNSAIWDDVAAKLGMIATVGGQYNVGYFICTQSFNIASSGVADSNIRLNLALLAQGLVRTTSNDEEQGSFGVIEQMINNSKVIASKETRDRLATDLRDLIDISMSEQTPIILSTIGNPILGLMPKLDVKTPIGQQYADSTIDVDYWADTDENAKTEPCEPNENKGCDRRFTNLNLDYEAARQHILTLTEKHNQTEILWMLWNAKPGKNQAYETALAEFRELVKPSTDVS